MDDYYDPKEDYEASEQSLNEEYREIDDSRRARETKSDLERPY